MGEQERNGSSPRFKGVSSCQSPDGQDASCPGQGNPTPGTGWEPGRWDKGVAGILGGKKNSILDAI